ncbi:MAG: cytochrome C [Chloroflexi bacterium]|nr:cytochrome C [Chloroflexota bacterium]MCL5110656.1 cytochrome C [Chloroflexota bacterium]
MANISRTVRPLQQVPAYFIRFTLNQRLEHALLILSFTMLSLTGIPQKFHTAPWADWLIGAMSGIEMVRQIHHFFAAVFVLESVYHVGYVAYVLFVRKGAASMLPGLNDVREALHLVFHYAGLVKSKPRHDRFDFRQKFEYWGIIWGGAMMIITGIVIWFPVQVTQLIPGQLVPAAKAAHGGEALLAVLTIIIWHMYGAHFSAHALPFDKTIFTGRISAERMLEEHPREFERLVGQAADEEYVPVESEPVQTEPIHDERVTTAVR